MQSYYFIIKLLCFYCACFAFIFFTPLNIFAKENFSGNEKKFTDPIFKGSRTSKERTPVKGFIGMKDAVFRALEGNPSLGAQESQAKSSEESKKARRGAFGPKLSMNYAANKQYKKSDPVGMNRLPEYGTFSYGLEISQPIFQGFRLLADYQKAALQEDSDKASLRNAELAMTTEVQTQFLLVLQARENVKSEAESLARLKDQLRITRAFYEVGLRPKLDVLQAEVDVSQAENTLIKAENTRDTAYAKLNTLLGYPAQSKIEYQGKLNHVPFKRSLEQCIKLSYENRPDLFIAEKSVKMAEKDQLAVKGGYYPQVNGYYSITKTGNSPDLQKLGNNGSESTVWEIGAQATWEVFQWGTTYYDDKRTGWLVTKMKQTQDELKLSVGYEVKSRFLAVREAEKRIVVADKGVAQAKEAYEAALARYQEQVGTNFDVLDASYNLTRAEASLISAKADYLTALSQLYTAMGEFHPDLLKP